MSTVTETKEVKRGDGKVVLEITYTPRVGRPVRMYHLAMKVKSYSGCPSDKIFVYQRSAKGAPMEDGTPRDEFVCVADELDEDEIPKDAPNIAAGVPYYRVSDMELIFRNPDLMYETMHEILRSIAS